MAAFHEFASTNDLLIQWLVGVPAARIELLLNRPVGFRELERDPALVDRVLALHSQQRGVERLDDLARLPTYREGAF